MSVIIRVDQLDKIYDSGFQALKGVNLEIQRGEIFALLGPNGAGKTTLISIICGIANASAGRVEIDGMDIQRQFRQVRGRVGLVPQELSTDGFESVWSTVKLSRGLFGKPANPAYLERVLGQLSLLEKRDERIMALSGGMKRRVMIAKALSHEPDILFLDEPTAGVDVELRRDMWDMVRELRERGVTIILTTHYIEEAEEMADRIGIINRGEIVLVDDKQSLMTKLGQKQLRVQLAQRFEQLPGELSGFPLTLGDGGTELVYHYDSGDEQSGIAELLRRLDVLGIEYRDLHSSQRSLEEIFVSLVSAPREAKTGEAQ